MGTYFNCYDLVKKVRMMLDEQSPQLQKGRDVSGRYSNDLIVDGINAAQRYFYALLMRRYPALFFETVDLTAVSSVFTLPADFGQLLYFKDSDGRQIFNINEKYRKLTASTGSDRLYTRRGNTLVLDKGGLTSTCTLFYYRKPRDLDQGKASAGAATSITLATSAKMIVDYYNGMTIENDTQGWVDTISDYSITVADNGVRVATISETAAANDYYGIVSDLPEMFHHLFVPQAVMNITGFYPRALEKPSQSGSVIFNENLRAALSAFTDNRLDRDPSGIIDDWMETESLPYGIIMDGN